MAIHLINGCKRADGIFQDKPQNLVALIHIIIADKQVFFKKMSSFISGALVVFDGFIPVCTLS